MAIVKSVSQLGCVLQVSDALASQGTKEFRGNPMEKVLNAIRSVRFIESTLRESRRKTDHRLKKDKSNLDISEVPTLQN